MNHAASVAFHDIHYRRQDWDAVGRLTPDQRKNLEYDDYPMVDLVRRPHLKEIEVIAMFPQLWGSTALGFGGIGGAAMTDAYTVVVSIRERGVIAVYWGGRYAYTLDTAHMTPEQKEHFQSDLMQNSTAPTRDAARCISRRCCTVLHQIALDMFFFFRRHVRCV